MALLHRNRRPGNTAPTEPLSTKDKITIGLLLFFMVIALSIEAYWLRFHNSMESRTDVFAQVLSLYWSADHSYRISGYGSDKAFTLALESVNTLFSQWLNAILIYAISQRRPYRHALQLTLATYSAYGTFLYYYVAHLNGYAVFANHSLYPFLIFYLVNAPWFLGYTWMAYVSFSAINSQFRITSN